VVRREIERVRRIRVIRREVRAWWKNLLKGRGNQMGG
jgi:hypothetical protein